MAIEAKASIDEPQQEPQLSSHDIDTPVKRLRHDKHKLRRPREANYSDRLDAGFKMLGDV